MKKVLVVDDDPDITLLVKIKLEKTGRFEVIFTNAGSRALELAKTEQPDIIICDIDIPDKSGGEVAEELIKDPDTGQIPILFFSSLVNPGDIVDGKVGGRDMVSKSSAPEVLIERLDGSTLR